MDASYEQTRKSIAEDRQHRLKLEEENAKRRRLPPIPRPQPFRPTPQCGPTPGWLLTPDEQDEAILRCMVSKIQKRKRACIAYMESTVD